MKKTKFSLGFIFDAQLQNVLLIQKNRPDWQKGKWNGLGGHVEKGETYLQTIEREVFEESGLNIPANEWIKVGEMKLTDSICWVFAAIYKGELTDIQIKTDEILAWHSIRNIPINVLSNLTWLIPFAIDKLTHSELLECIIFYNKLPTSSKNNNIKKIPL